MKPIKYNDTDSYQFMEVFNVEGAFTELRIDRESIPDGFYKYSLREGEEEFIGQICNEVLVNHAGDFITKEPFELGPDGSKVIKSEDWGFTGKEFNFEEYFGSKLSLDYQIDQAEAKRNEQMGMDPKAKGMDKVSPLGRSEPEL